MTIRHTRVAGHFGEFLQGRVGPDGPVALVTLSCPVLAVAGHFRADRGFFVHGHGQRLATPARALRLLRALRLAPSGRFCLAASMPLGGGAGASTAALVALARLAGWQGDPLDLARACVLVEGASDPTMFPAPERLIWASRCGAILGVTRPLPRFEVIGGFHGPVRRTDPRDGAFPDVADLLGDWSRATEQGDRAGLAALAGESARRTLALRGPADDPTERLARDLGALGHAIAHTGAARSLLFAPGTVPDDWARVLRTAGLRQLVRFQAGG